MPKKKINGVEIKDLIESDPDFINIKRFDYSLSNLLKRYPEGVPDRIIAAALQMTEDEIQSLYTTVLDKLRKKINNE